MRRRPVFCRVARLGSSLRRRSFGCSSFLSHQSAIALLPDRPYTTTGTHLRSGLTADEPPTRDSGGGVVGRNPEGRLPSAVHPDGEGTWQRQRRTRFAF